MKDKIVYVVIFAIIFALVSGGLVFLNGKFNNIFKFDFSPIQPPKPLTAQKKEPGKEAVKDSTKKEATPTKIDSLKMMADSITNAKLNPPKKETAKPDDKKSAPDKNNNVAAKEATAAPNSTTQAQTTTPSQDKIQKAKKDSAYVSWVKQTVKLYESMDSRKAAKVIQGYSDNIARDILLKMKKKKAAEILAELKPEVVTRIISIN